MKFGKNFILQQVPLWADVYVNYDKWKVLAKMKRLKGNFAPSAGLSIIC
jgi:SPX domain protein involved in polyphosphate accumulation